MDPVTVSIVGVGVSLTGVVGAYLSLNRARSKDAADTARREGEQSAEMRGFERRISDLEKRADSHDDTREQLSVLKQAVHDMKNGMQRMENGLGGVQANLQELLRALAQGGLGRRQNDRMPAE